MNYDLCKKLKEAGFPQTTEKFYVLDKPQGKTILAVPNEFHPSWGLLNHEKYPNLYEPPVAAPTLSELIEWCGEHFRFLVKHDNH